MPETKTLSAIRLAIDQLNTPRRQMIWAVDFAQTALETASPGRLIDLAYELSAFQIMGGVYGSESLQILGRSEMIFTTDALTLVQEHFRRILGSVLASQNVNAGPFDVIMKISHGRLKLAVTHDEHGVAVSVVVLSLLLRNFAEALKSCPAPKVRGAEGEVCGRWFIGRTNQTYCATTCLSRTTSHALKERQQATE